MAEIADNTETAVANEALGACKAGRLSVSLEADTSEKAKQVRLYFATIRDALQRRYKWNFNEAYLSLPEGGATVPDGFDFTTRYPWNSEMLGVRRVIGCAKDDWTVQGRSILSNLSAPLKVVATVRQTNVGVWDALFRTAFVAVLAYAIAPVVAPDEETIERCRLAADRAYANATPVDAGEGVQETPPDYDVISERC